MLALSLEDARATGFEKNGLWSARSAALAGTGVTVVGADALYFNPAGIATRTAGQQMSINVSVSQVQAKGPINNSNDQETSIAGISPVGGVLYSYAIDSKLAFGAGIYGLAGGAIKYNAINFPGYVGGPLPAYSDLSVAEIAVGAAYRFTSEFSAGLALRYDIYELSQAQPSRQIGGIALAAPEFSKLKGTDMKGFKLGGQYQLGKSTRLGLTYRSETSATLSGEMTGGLIESPIFSARFDPANASVKMTIPQALTLGANFILDPKWSLVTEYCWTNYAKLKDLTMVTDSGLVGTQVSVQNWKDMNTFRVGTEYRAGRIPIRFGYAYSSQVTDADLASPTMAPPAPTHSLSLGSGLFFKIGKSPAVFDYAVDYASSSGTGGTASVTNGADDHRQGTYSISVLSIHSSFRFGF